MQNESWTSDTEFSTRWYIKIDSMYTQFHVQTLYGNGYIDRFLTDWKKACESSPKMFFFSNFQDIDGVKPSR